MDAHWASSKPAWTALSGYRQAMKPDDAEERREPPEAVPGIPCRKCGCCDLRVIWTRRRFGFITRMRECRHCGLRTITRERAS
jgi:hypothetical protein